MSIMLPTSWGKPQVSNTNFFQGLVNKWNMKIGRVMDLLVSPCHADTPGGHATHVTLWVLAAFTAVPQVIQSFSTHDCSDNVYDKTKQLWRPIRPRGGGRHGRRGTAENRGGESIPGDGKKATGWQQQVFRLGDMAQRLGAGLIIVDAALDFAINWQSQWMNWAGCGPPPPVFTTASVARDVVGCGSGDLRNDMAGHPGSVGIICGIGGFATTVPVGNLEFAGSLADHQFLFTQYSPLNGTSWLVDAVGGGQKPVLDQRQTMAPSQDGSGTTHGSRASMNTLTSSGRTGSCMIARPSCPGGCQVDPGNLCTIMGQSEGLMFADDKADPCSNLPVTGTAVRGR